MAGEPPGAGSEGRGGMAEATLEDIAKQVTTPALTTRTEFQWCLSAKTEAFTSANPPRTLKQQLMETNPALFAGLISLKPRPKSALPFDCLFLLLCTSPADLIFSQYLLLFSSPNPTLHHPHRTSP